MYNKYITKKEGCPFNYAEFICDTEADIVKLPTDTKMGIQETGNTDDDIRICSIGSNALCLDTSDVYILSPLGIWTKL